MNTAANACTNAGMQRLKMNETEVYAVWMIG